ncbi:MAG TPA: c-type cytochrome [Clostridia bacterium]|nr:c-type cytochrome [Clostridia bacterium]
MKSYKPVWVAVFVLAVAMFLVLPSISWAADDAAVLYKTKCAACHGAEGMANTPMAKKQNITSFAADKVQKAKIADIEDCILNGGKEKKASHVFAAKGVSKEDAGKLATYVKSLGKK